MSDKPQFNRETSKAGAFVRQESAFRRFVRAEPHSESDCAAAAGRYHLYVSYAC